MTSQDKEVAKTLHETGGLGTVATRADIIEKLFSGFLLEKRGKDIFLTSKAVQLLSLVPEDLKKPELTADWEMKLSRIAKGKLKRREFMKEIRSYAGELTEEIKGGTGQFRHDNLTNTKCPVCGKRMLLVKGKNSQMLVCQDRECGHRETISRTSNARCPVCHKKMELRGKGDGQIFVCSCGYKEKLKAFKDRRAKEGAGVSKKDVARYLNQQKKEEQEPLNNALAQALAGLKLDPTPESCVLRTRAFPHGLKSSESCGRRCKAVRWRPGGFHIPALNGCRCIHGLRCGFGLFRQNGPFARTCRIPPEQG